MAEGEERDSVTDIPVSSTSVEWSFSALKCIKTCDRNSIGQIQLIDGTKIDRCCTTGTLKKRLRKEKGFIF